MGYDERHWLATATITLAILATAGISAPAQPAAKVESAAKVQPELLTAVKACDKNARTLLERVVAIDTGTGDAEGLRAVGELYAGELKGLGASVKMAPPPAGAPAGDNVVATLTGSGRGRVLLIAHMDTVFKRGDVARLKPH